MKLFDMHDAAVQKELVLLAAASPADTVASPRRWLFVGFADILFLESMVSPLAMLEKRHVGTHALMLDSVFTYHMDMKEARGEAKTRDALELRRLARRGGKAARRRRHCIPKRQIEPQQAAVAGAGRRRAAARRHLLERGHRQARRL
eukprot:137109-Pleurochrysis_carterae.AAC.1